MKTWVIVLVSVLGLGCIVFGIIALSSTSKKKEAVAYANKAMALVIKADSIAKAEYARREGMADDLNEATNELDTIRPVYAKADSLIKASKAVADSVSKANVELEKKLAEAITKAGKSSKATKDATTKNPSTANGPEAKKVLVTKLKLKGNPITNDKDSTFTYVKSDIALVAKFAPKGYTLVQKPR